MTTISERFGVTPPQVKKYKTAVPCINPDLVIGFELETENCQTLPRDFGEQLNRFNLRIESDGSLRGSAYEFLTLPMKTTNALAVLTDWFAYSKLTEENYSDRCSIHVHVNCTDLTTEQVSSVALLYTVTEEILFEFVGGNRDSGIYCIPWSQCRQHFNLVKRFLENPAEVLRNWSKYTAVNILPLANFGTMEFRQMHGSSDMAKITTWVNIIGALFKYGTATELKDLMTEIKSLNNNSEYQTFFSKVFQDVLPYNEVYREKLESGVILAKFSMTGMEKAPLGSRKPVVNEAQGAIPVDMNAIANSAGFIRPAADVFRAGYDQVFATTTALTPPPVARGYDHVPIHRANWRYNGTEEIININSNARRRVPNSVAVGFPARNAALRAQQEREIMAATRPTGLEVNYTPPESWDDEEIEDNR